MNTTKRMKQQMDDYRKALRPTRTTKCEFSCGRNAEYRVVCGIVERYLMCGDCVAANWRDWAKTGVDIRAM